MGRVWSVPATVISIVDGDTFHLNLDLGWHISYQARVRIAHVNAPEANTPEGVAAKDWAATQLAPGDAVSFTSRSLDKYGRPLGDLGYGLKDYGAELIEAGHGAVLNY
jgi:endonuclease YncB( thermonuclease family)